MPNRIRFATFDRAAIDMETGEFPMVLATDGEATDGDILSIEGAVLPERAPLLISHQNDPRATAGTVSRFRRDLTGSPKKLRARGAIELGGDGALAEIRRDVAYMIAQGHVTGVSVRWEPIEFVRRTELPKEHPAYVNGETEKDWRKRHGYYHKKWRVQEGSIVAVQADQAAVIGRAQETTGVLSEFWRRMAELTVDPVEVELTGTFVHGTGEIADEQRTSAQEHEVGEEPPTATTLIERALASGVDIDALRAALAEREAPRPPTVEEMAEQLSTATQQIATLRAEVAVLKERDPGEPLPPLRSVAAIINRLSSMLEERNRRALSAAQLLIERRTGKVSPEIQGWRDAAHAEAQQWLDAEKARIESELAGDLPPVPETDAQRVALVESVLQRMEKMVETAKQRISS